MVDQNTKQIFLSYSNKNPELADRFVKELEYRFELREENLRFWYDRRNMPGSNDWQEELDQALRASCALVILITPEFLASEWFIYEAGKAQGLNLRIVPVRVPEVSVNDLPAWLQVIKVILYPESEEDFSFLVDVIIAACEEGTPLSTETPRGNFTQGDSNIIGKEGEPPTAAPAAEDSPPPQTEGDAGIAAEGEFISGDQFVFGSSASKGGQPTAPPPTEDDTDTQPAPGDPQRVTTDDRTPLHNDATASFDYLGRKGFVKALAAWLDRYWDEFQTYNRSFIINVHGQWGAGKSTLLKLLQGELREEKYKDWFVVWFNAWENHHIQPEWWPLLDQIFKDALKSKTGREKFRLWRRELWRRFYLRGTAELFGFIVSGLIFAFVIFWVMRPGFAPELHFMKQVEEVVKPLAAFVSFLLTFYTGAKVFTQSVLFGSAKNAEVFLRMVSDPIQEIKHNFQALVTDINQPVLIYIDDLDRCDENYLVSLLESMQTILNDQRVFYIVAADQRWLTKAFEKKYENFKGGIREPGKQLSYLFLEKIFQLTLTLPSISDEAKQAFLDYLLGVEKNLPRRLQEARQQAAQAFEGVTGEVEILATAEESTGDTLFDLARKEEAVAQSASQAVAQETEHFLTQFAHLMEPNPRSMKRMVTYYGVLRAIAILTDISIVRNEDQRMRLALWTIVKMRWPDLADYLEETPEDVEAFKNQDPQADVEEFLKPLLKLQDVQEVLGGEGVAVELDAQAIRQFLKLKSTVNTN